MILVRTFRGERAWKKSYQVDSKHSKIKYWNDKVHESIIIKQDSESREWTQVRNQAHRWTPGQSTTSKWQRTIWSKRILCDHLIKPWLCGWVSRALEMTLQMEATQWKDGWVRTRTVSRIGVHCFFCYLCCLPWSAYSRQETQEEDLDSIVRQHLALPSGRNSLEPT